MEVTSAVLLMLLAVVVSRVVARVTRLPVPLVQIALGATIVLSRLTAVEFDPQVFFLLLLPPLLFLDGWRTPNEALVRDAPTILTLAFGLVVFTVLCLGLLMHWLIPGLPLAVAFALAAAVSPTDPVAVSSIAARAPIPARLRHILQGEALFNDASGLVCMRFAIAAALTGSFVLSSALASLVWVALGGVAIGVAATWAVTRAKPSTALVGDDGGAQILLTLLLPSGVYLLAEQLNCSGILAAVAAGITMGFAPHAHWQAVTRIRRTAVWEMVQFAANGSIFVLLGEQIPSILSQAPETVRITGHGNPWWLAAYVVGIVVALAALRFAWVWMSLRLTLQRRRAPASLPTVSQARLVAAVSLAGVRGAVTLAGVLTIPLVLADGSPFPGRDLAIFLASGVIVVSLCVATLGLPHALKGLELPVDRVDYAAESKARTAAAHAAIRAIESHVHQTPSRNSSEHADTAARVADLYRQRIERYADTAGDGPLPGGVDGVERAVRLAGLHAEREEMLRSAQEHGVGEAELRKLVREIDLQEARYLG